MVEITSRKEHVICHFKAGELVAITMPMHPGKIFPISGPMGNKEFDTFYETDFPPHSSVHSSSTEE